MKILISGSLAYDFVMDFPDSFKNHIMPDSLHILNVCFMIDKLNKGWGGTAGNIAYNFSLLGMEPEVVSAIGRDGKDYIERLKKVGVGTDNILRDEEKFTSSAYITTDKDDNQITAFYNGPLGLAEKININSLSNDYKLVLISPTQKNVMLKHLKESKEKGIETVFDPGQQITAFNEQELQQAVGNSSFIIGNDYEIKLLLEKTGFKMDDILQTVKAVIITLGEKGSMIVTATEKIEVGVCVPQSIDDPTGAGDAYRAGFFTGYLLGFDFRVCGQMGAVAAAYAIEKYGTQAHVFSKEEFCARYEKQFKEKIIL